MKRFRSVWLIIGLGNPGRKYQFTRHNIGFRVIDRLSKALSVPLNKMGLMAKWGKGQWEDQGVVLAKPQTFMNLSGEAVLRLIHFFQVDTENLIVIHDDLDLDLEQIRIRERGGDGGHKGIKSIIEHLGTKEFIRIRLGISRPDKKEEGKDYVLSDFVEHQKKMLNVQLGRAEAAVKTIIFEGTAKAMNQFNRKKGELTLNKGE